MDGLPLTGRTVGVTAERKAQEQADVLRRRGATVVLAPTVRTVAVDADGELRRVTEAVLADPPDYVVAITGGGMRGWLDAAQRWGRRDQLLAALAGAEVVARGAKAASTVRAVGLRESWRAPHETVEEVREHLLARALAGTRIAVQLHGADVERLTGALRGAGAEVLEAPVYRWTLPADVAPAERLLDSVVERRIHAVTFTSAPAVGNLFRLAERSGRADAVRGAFAAGVVACCVGPVCAEAAVDEGITDPLVPERARLVPMIDALAARLAR